MKVQQQETETGRLPQNGEERKEQEDQDKGMMKTVLSV